MHYCLKMLFILWALPMTLIGLAFTFFAVLTRSKTKIENGTICVFGGLLLPLIMRHGIPFLGGGAAACIGHVIFARDINCLNVSFAHEYIHVKQFERWGIFLPVAYLACALYLRLRGFHPYLDNPFEREACDDS